MERYDKLIIDIIDAYRKHRGEEWPDALQHIKEEVRDDFRPTEEEIQKTFDLTRQMVAEMHRRGEGNPIDKQRISYIIDNWEPVGKTDNLKENAERQ